MGRTHSNGYNRIKNFFPELQYQPVLKAVCSRSADKVRAFADQWGYESFETDWKKLVTRDDIDAIDICTPNNSHAEIAIAAAEAGKMVLCEKPLALTLAGCAQPTPEQQFLNDAFGDLAFLPLLELPVHGLPGREIRW